MITLAEGTDAHRTSAAGPMLAKQARPQVLAGILFFELVTSSAGAAPSHGHQRAASQTTAGAPAVHAALAGRSIADLRRLSGLTWEQLARLFDVSRRSLHFWASGKAMSAAHEERLQRILEVVRKVDRGSASANRGAFFAADKDEGIPFDLLAEGEYERVVALLGQGEVQRARAPKVSAQTMTARAPRPPAELVDALQDRIHPASGRLLSSKPVRVPRSK
jgi:DNA-binding transcriptional regulator YiaG